MTSLLIPTPGQPELRSTTLEAEMHGRTFVGYAGVYGSTAEIADFTETVLHPAFAKVLAEQRTNVPFLYDHTGTQVTSRTTQRWHAVNQSWAKVGHRALDLALDEAVANDRVTSTQMRRSPGELTSTHPTPPPLPTPAHTGRSVPS